MTSPTQGLAGRETLARVVGKRKRTLSSRLARLLLQPQPQPQPKEEEDSKNPSSSLVKEKEGDQEGAKWNPGDGKFSSGYTAAGANCDSEWVSCPVCGVSVRGTDYIINSHLDTCLSRGNKRKATQRTLLQFNFCEMSKRKNPQGVVGEHIEERRESKIGGGGELTNSDTSVTNFSSKNNETSHPSNALDEDTNNSLKCNDTQTENKEAKHTVDHMVFPQTTRHPVNGPYGVEDAEFAKVMDTFIVGRKFHDDVQLQEGDKVFLSREPENVKDKHAIKVLYADSGSLHMLGYLRRELAKFLSPLIENQRLKCEGCITSLPEHSLDVVPIQVVCQKKMGAIDETENDDYQNFQFLWENVQRAAESAKTNPPSMTKYQQNFCLMIDHVASNNTQLLTSNEKVLLGLFHSLSNDAQRLFIRIYTRKGPWFRMSNISYSEISDSQRASEELQLGGYICTIESSEDIIKYNLKEVLAVLSVIEMREISNLQLSKKASSCARRHELIDALYSAYEDGTCLLLPQMVLEKVGKCIKVSSDADMLLWRVQRLFFLNGEQDLSAFLLSDLGLIKFPDYCCMTKYPVYQCRSDLLEYEEAVEMAQIMDESLDNNNMDMVMRCIRESQSYMQSSSRDALQSSGHDSPPAFFRHFLASWVYSKVLSLGVSVYERERRYEDAIMLLKELLHHIRNDSCRGNWTLRLSVDLEHIGRVNESLSVAEEGLLDPWVRAGAKMALQRRVLRLGKPPRRWKIPAYANSVKRTIKETSIRGRPLNSEIGSKNIFYGYDGELCGVEQLALQFYGDEGGGWQGVHSESGIWMTIFGILMWDVIFSDVPDVFRSRFQMAPLDLFTDDFYVARKNIIEDRLQKIQEGMAKEILVTSWGLHVGTACLGVNWDRHSLSDLRAVVSCIGGSCLASLCRHLALDYRNWSRGMPDLLLWRFCGGEMGRGEAKLVEVKGPRDRLSEQQRAWMLILMDCGFDVEVCKVSPNAKS